MKQDITLTPPETGSAEPLDPDNPPWTEGMLGPPVLRAGRPRPVPAKVVTSLHLDADVLAWFEAPGAGAEARINDALRRAMEQGRA